MFILIFILFSCQKQRSKENFDIKQILNLKNYQIQRVKINDSIDKIEGKNSDFTISGNLNIKTNRKDGWWKISNKNMNENFEIEFVDIKPENFNQLKFYKNGKLRNDFSTYYEIKKAENNFNLQFNFPKEKGKQFASLQYLIFDTISKKLLRDEKKELKKNTNSYLLSIPLNKSENAILGSISEFTTNEMKNDSARMEVMTIYFKH